MSRREARSRRPRGTGGWMVLIAGLVLAVAFLGSRPLGPTQPASTGQQEPATVQRQALPGFLPPEARTTLRLIARGGPFPHPQDGAVFGNFEGHLPRQPRGWYHEYTVETPGLSNRGTRRIVTGGTPPSSYWYTADHYASFRPFQVERP